MHVLHRRTSVRGRMTFSARANGVREFRRRSHAQRRRPLMPRSPSANGVRHPPARRTRRTRRSCPDLLPKDMAHPCAPVVRRSRPPSWMGIKHRLRPFVFQLTNPLGADSEAIGQDWPRRMCEALGENDCLAICQALPGLHQPRGCVCSKLNALVTSHLVLRCLGPPATSASPPAHPSAHPIASSRRRRSRCAPTTACAPALETAHVLPLVE